MTYWMPATPGGSDWQMGAQNTAPLLASLDGNGNCESWSALFRDVIRLNGINDASRMRVYHPPLPLPGIFAKSVLVNQWNFGTPPSTPTNPNYPYTITDTITTPVNPGYAQPGAILPGQGNNNTPPVFNAHWKSGALDV